MTAEDRKLECEGNMNSQPVLTAPQIRQYYAQAIRESNDGQLNYLMFYEWLRARGLRPKGSGHKEQHRSIVSIRMSRGPVYVFPGRCDVTPSPPHHFRILTLLLTI